MLHTACTVGPMIYMVIVAILSIFAIVATIRAAWRPIIKLHYEYAALSKPRCWKCGEPTKIYGSTCDPCLATDLCEG